MTASLRVRVALLVAVGLLLAGFARSAGDLDFWRRYAGALWRGDGRVPSVAWQPVELLRGGDGGGLPRNSPEEEGVEAAAVQAASQQAQDQGGDALFVLRHGHLLHERHFHGTAAAPIDSGDFALLLRSVATAAAIHDGLLDVASALPEYRRELDAARGPWRNPWSRAARLRFGAAAAPEYLRAATHRSYAQFVAAKIWSPLDAADAMLWRDAKDDRVHTGCCLLARPGDWLRVAQLLLAAGRLDGETILSEEWLARLYAAPAIGAGDLGLQHGSAARGPEPFVTTGVYFARGTGDSRLWLVPKLQLAILYVAAGAPQGRTDDTTLPNVILRGMNRSPLQSGERREDQPDIHTLVPAH
jgi:Beta-lactamase